MKPLFLVFSYLLEKPTLGKVAPLICLTDNVLGSCFSDLRLLLCIFHNRSIREIINFLRSPLNIVTFIKTEINFDEKTAG